MATVTRHGWVPALPNLALNQYDRALEATQEALRLRPNDIPALVQLGATDRSPEPAGTDARGAVAAGKTGRQCCARVFEKICN